MMQEISFFHEKIDRQKYFIQILEKITAIVYNGLNKISAEISRFINQKGGNFLWICWKR